MLLFTSYGDRFANRTDLLHAERPVAQRDNSRLAKALQKSVSSPRARAGLSKVVDDESNAAQEERTSSSPSIEFGFRSVASRRPQQRIWFETSMHFSFYLMIAALVILGVEVAYALYQLANYFL